METENNWIIIIRGEAEGQEVRVAIDFQDTESIFGPSKYVVGAAFIDQLLTLIQLHEHWVIKTVIEEIRTPKDIRLPNDMPLFAVLTKSHPRGLSAGTLFLAEDIALTVNEESELPPITSNESVFDATERFTVVGVSPIGFAVACTEDTRLFTRFISRLLQRPEAFTDVSLLLPRSFRKRSKK